MLRHPCCMLHHAHRLLHHLLHWSLWHSHHALRVSDHHLLCCHLVGGQVAGDTPLTTGCVQYSPGVAPHTKMAAKRALLSLRVKLLLLLCLQHVRASVHCLVAMLPACLEGLEDLLPHTGVLVDGFVGLCHHLDLGSVSLCRYVCPLRLLLHGVGSLRVVQGGRLGHHHVGGALLQHAVEAAAHRNTLHAQALLGGAGEQVHLLVEDSHPLLLLGMLLQLLLGVLLRVLLGVLLGVLGSPLRVPPLALLLGGCELLPLILRCHHCRVLLLLVGSGQVLLVGGVPLPHPPLLVHLHGLLLGVSHLGGALWSPHLVYVVLLMMGAHPCCGGRGVVLRSGVAGW